MFRIREEPEGLDEMMITITNELKNINKRCNKDREELLNLIKEQEKRKGPDAISLRGDTVTSSTSYQIRMQAARKGLETNQTRLPTSPPSNLSTQRGCSAKNNKLPRYILVRKRPAR